MATADAYRDGADKATDAAPDEHARIIAMLASIVESLGQALPPTSELLLHDLSKLPNSIVAISGTVTRRSVGDPATDLLLRAAARGDFQTRIGYETRLGDGRRMKSSTVIVRDSDGAAVAAMCVNVDLSAWEQINQLSGLMLGLAGVGIGAAAGGAPGPVAPLADDAASASEDTDELFTSDVDELAMHLIQKATAVSGIPIELMRKQHKLEIVRELSNRGFFMLKGAADKAATALKVSRFTIYNYLNEISDGEDDRAGQEQQEESA